MPTLETLPPEILFHILSFTNPFKGNGSNPLGAVAKTSQHLNSIAEEYARSLLQQHASLSPKAPYIKKWVTWASKTCQYCKRNSTRRAILDAETTCCAKCDKKFPKMTMTDATTKHGLSKLDLFTPNVLHPNLPPLTFGTYMCMGGETMMISESDVLARKGLIQGMLGEDAAKDPKYLTRRRAAHSRIMEAMDIEFRSGRWMKAHKFRLDAEGKVKKMFRTAESREQYLKQYLEKEWADMGMSGYSAETAITLE